MNERIKALAEQAEEIVFASPSTGRTSKQLNIEKFAELIVAECVHTALKDALPDWGNEASSANTQCVKIAAEIKQHFGVE